MHYCLIKTIRYNYDLFLRLVFGWSVMTGMRGQLDWNTHAKNKGEV